MHLVQSTGTYVLFRDRSRALHTAPVVYRDFACMELRIGGGAHFVVCAL